MFSLTLFFFLSASLYELEVLKAFPKFKCAGPGMGFGQHLRGGCLGVEPAGAWVRLELLVKILPDCLIAPKLLLSVQC